MRNLLAVSALPLVLGTALPAFADDKIGYVDMARALNEVEDGKSAKAKLKKEFDEKQKKLDAMQSQLKAKKEDFDKQQAMMKPEVKAQKREELGQELEVLKQTYVQLQQELMANESDLTQAIAGKLRKVIGKIGDRDGYTMILNTNDGVLYHKRHMDITDAVVREYNAEYGAGGGGAQGGGGSSKK
jgi:outer membrane protein